jgi:hypothetical protein
MLRLENSLAFQLGQSGVKCGYQMFGILLAEAQRRLELHHIRIRTVQAEQNKLFLHSVCGIKTLIHNSNNL